MFGAHEKTDKSEKEQAKEGEKKIYVSSSNF